jgi:hypothetical protein
MFRFVRQRFRTETASGVVEIRRGYSDANLLDLPAGCLDWVYVDANHAKEYALADLNAAVHALDANGFILGHDYCTDDRRGHTFGVISAVDEFLDSHPDMVLVGITNEDFPTYVIAPSRRSRELAHRLGVMQ